jgi:hypothetical protein
VDDSFCDILKCGAEFCEGAGVIAEMGVGVYLSIILIIINNPPLLTIPSIYNTIQSSNNQTKK